MNGRVPIDRTRRAALGSLLALACVVLGTPGCATRTHRPSPRGRSAIEEVHLFGVPVALHLDGRPVPDAVGVRVYASNNGRAHGLAIARGRLEIVMFDGVFDPPATPVPQPLKIWSFGPRELVPFAAETSLGTGYQLALRWGNDRPTGTAVTVLARYTTPDGTAFESSTTSIPLK